MKLRKEQEELESKLRLRVIGLSLFDTILQVLQTHYSDVVFHLLLYLTLKCIKNRHFKVADQLKKEYRISDNQ